VGNAFHRNVLYPPIKLCVVIAHEITMRMSSLRKKVLTFWNFYAVEFERREAIISWV